MSCINRMYIPKAGYLVPCGKCFDCIKRKVTDWSTRLHFEELYSKTKPLFITLTYNHANLKFSRLKGKYATLCKRDLQLFFKRLRKRSQRRPDYSNNIKYLAVGEYGTKNKRPHYHVLLFNVHEQDVRPAWSNRGQEIGEIYYGDVSNKSIAYVTGYALTSESNRTHVLQNNLISEFHLYSNGLGKVYTTGTAAIRHNRRISDGEPDQRVYIDGQPRPLPRYYTDRLYTPTNKQLLKKQLQAIADSKNLITLTKKQFSDEIRNSTRKLEQRRKSTVA